LHAGEAGLTLNSLMRTLDGGVDGVALVVRVAARVADVGESSGSVVVLTETDDEVVVLVEGAAALRPLPHAATENSARTDTTRRARRRMNGGYADAPPYPGQEC